MDDDLLTSLLGFLPASWLPWLRIVAELSFALSLAAVPAKKLLGEPKPSDPTWKRLLFTAMQAVDFLAANSTPLRQKVKSAHGRSVPPPAALVPLLVVVLVPMAASSCAASPLHTHAIAADAAGTVIDQARSVIEDEMRAAEQAAVDAAPTRETAAAAVAAVRERFYGVELAYDGVRAAHAAYVRAIVRADVQGADTPQSSAVQALRDAWHLLEKSAAALPLRLPAAPAEFARLTGGAP